ncbi:hypothetical protein LEP1GSC047_0583 [Leptospira inadai serovar Lyme str. 10]|uniref:Uncharacterized protein n=2 Tax=Leptospira inadai serovar Lyme TaxID=293084 RepID=V6HHN0_9LEPT|nr:hypothetical protein [Leptospira inadai]EQA35970.1 hypothetical protein LEP1GSC047_0583 [Leptospira inadai serovar Lyme str. 10]PNV77037.1 hypothetical protein BES34_001850 [Leptospira inadai serovar Lyme]
MNETKPKFEISGPKAIALGFLFAAPIFFLLGYWSKGCGSIGRQAKVTYSGSFTEGTLVSLDEKKLVLKDPDFTIPLETIEKIEFLEDARSLQAGQVPLSDAEKNFIGTYKLQVGMHKGVLVLFPRKTGGIGGTMRFSNWGKGVNESLGQIKVIGKSIRYTRSCTGARCSEIGSNVPFSQTYTGELEGKKIQGAYQGTNSSGRWTAER